MEDFTTTTTPFLTTHAAELDNQFTTASDVRNNWQPEFADILVPHHREYCHYQHCVTYRTTRIYSLEMNLIEDQTAALNTGYLNPLGMAHDNGTSSNAQTLYTFNNLTVNNDPTCRA